MRRPRKSRAKALAGIAPLVIAGTFGAIPRAVHRLPWLLVLGGLLLLLAAPASLADVVWPPPTPQPPITVSPTTSPVPSVSPSGAPAGGGDSGKTVAVVAGAAGVVAVAAISLAGLRRIARGRRPDPPSLTGSDSAAGEASGDEADG